MLHIGGSPQTGCRFGYVPEACCLWDVFRSQGGEFRSSSKVDRTYTVALEVYKTIGVFFCNQRLRDYKVDEGEKEKWYI